MTHRRIAPTVDQVAPANDDLIDMLRDWARREFEAGEDQKILPVLPETLLALLKRLEVVEAAVKMGVTAH